MKDLKKLCPKRMGREIAEREYDLLIRNRVTQEEYTSRMAVWKSIEQAPNQGMEVEDLVSRSYENLRVAQGNINQALKMTYEEFSVTAKDEIGYIKNHVLDFKLQAFWYATILLFACGIVSLYI